MKAGTVCLIGRPNTGKSTLLNAILGQKVSITSPKPQTTRFAIQAIYEDDRGQIVFIDTPGVFAKTNNQISAHANSATEATADKGIDIVIYLIDHTRKRDIEENKVLGIVRKINAPKILAINKIDIKNPSHIIQYKFIEREVDAVINISALQNKNIPTLLDLIFSYLPNKKSIVDTTNLVQPGLNINSKTFIAEIIREKAFLFLRREVPYSIATIVDDIIERTNGSLYIRARILTSKERYKGMIVGQNGAMIKEISMASRKELETATGKKIFLDLLAEVDTHWMEYL